MLVTTVEFWSTSCMHIHLHLLLHLHVSCGTCKRLVVSACSCQLAAEPRYRAVAGKQGMVECQRRGDIVAVLPRLELAWLWMPWLRMRLQSRTLPRLPK